MPIENVKLSINGYNIPEIKSYSLKYDLFQGAAIFDAEIDRDYVIRLEKDPIPFIWNINGTDVMKGFVERVERDYTKGSHTLRINGRDMMQVFVDNYLMKHETLLDKTIKQVIDTVVADSFSVSSIKNLQKQGSKYNLVTQTLSQALSLPKVNIKYTPQALNIVSRVSSMKTMRKELGQTLFEFISHMINSAGLFMYNIPGTNDILIHSLIQPEDHLTSYSPQGTPVDYKFTIDNAIHSRTDNRPYSRVIACSYNQDISNYYKLIRLYGMCGSEGDYTALGQWGLNPNKLRIDKIESDDPKQGYTGVTKFKVIQTHALNTEMWVKERPLLINNDILQQNRKLFNIKYTVPGHTASLFHGNQNTLYFFNVVANVFDEYIPVEGQFLVYAVEYRGSKDAGQSTVLELCLPGSQITASEHVQGTPKIVVGQTRLGL